MRKFSPSCGVGREWDTTKSCGTGMKTPSFGPVPPHCHPLLKSSNYIYIASFSCKNILPTVIQALSMLVNYFTNLTFKVLSNIYKILQLLQVFLLNSRDCDDQVQIMLFFPMIIKFNINYCCTVKHITCKIMFLKYNFNYNY